MLQSSSKDFFTATAQELANRPPFRRLRGYAFDPSLSLQLDTVSINHAVFEVPWESTLQPGPRGEYVEVVDYDPASGTWYEPIDLNSTVLLAQDGVAPSEGNPQFHQQMVYAVAMNTIANFERALGRQVFWSPHDDSSRQKTTEYRETFVKTLRIYPHALRAANAYYSPTKKALLFGYFQSVTGMVFSCLSQDIVAHETTHALLDGMHRRYLEDTHPDTLAFHEAFADLVALFQHFTFRDVLWHQIDRTRGNLETQSLLGALAQQFGEATGRYGALRDAIGETQSDGTWKIIQPSPSRYRDASEPHDRGSILVAAMFAAFLAIYKTRTKGVVALASEGSGLLPEGALHPSLVDALASEATKTAQHFLQMAIRALDYCPPFSITFGDYLRALITSDFDMVPNDKYGYRVALIESFRRWGIVPTGLKTLSEEQLRWPYAKLEFDEGWNTLAALVMKLKPLIAEALFIQDRERAFNSLRQARSETHDFLATSFRASRETAQRDAFMRITGLDLSSSQPEHGIKTIKSDGLPSFEVHSVQPALRVTPSGQILKQLMVTVTQRIREMPIDPDDPARGTFDYRAGSTMIFDMEGRAPTLRYAITRPMRDPERLSAIQHYLKHKQDGGLALRSLYFKGVSSIEQDEPFCFLHDEH
jgi:hypothetical protein